LLAIFDTRKADTKSLDRCRCDFFVQKDTAVSSRKLRPTRGTIFMTLRRRHKLAANRPRRVRRNEQVSSDH
jgi:hypothetical protein